MKVKSIVQQQSLEDFSFKSRNADRKPLIKSYKLSKELVSCETLLKKRKVFLNQKKNLPITKKVII
jgi:hypothetical protein